MSDAFEQEVIRRESGGRPLIGWGNTDLSRYPLNRYGFPDWPGKPGPAGISTAGGLYGITKTNWNRLAPQVGVSDFSPESQRKVYQALYSEAGESAWRPFWSGGGGGKRGTSTFDPESGRMVPRVNVTPVNRDPLDALLLLAGADQTAPKEAESGVGKAWDLLKSFIEPPAQPQGEVGAKQPTEPPAPAPEPMPLAGGAAVGGLDDLLGEAAAKPVEATFVEPPGRDAELPKLFDGKWSDRPPQETPPQASQGGGLLDGLLRYADTSLHAMKGAPGQIAEAAGQIGQAALGVGERAGLAEEGIATGQVREPQIPVQPGAERVGDAATFLTGGLMSPMGVEARVATPTVASPAMQRAGQIGRELLADESGAVTIPPALQQGVADASKSIEKFFSPTTYDDTSRAAEALIRREVGRGRRESEKSEAQISARGPLANAPAASRGEAIAKEPWRPLVNRYVPEFNQYIAARQQGLVPPRPALLKFLDFVETRSQGTKYDGPPELRPLADILRKEYTKRRLAIASEPSTSEAGFIEDYVAHQWKDPGKAAQTFEAAATGRQGSGRNLRERTIPTISEGIDLGLVPVSADPIEMTMRYVTNMDRYLAHNRIFRLGREFDQIKFYPLGHQPEGWKEVNGRLAEKAAPVSEDRAIKMQAYAPEGFARVYNNAISTGFLAGELGGKFYTALLHAKNAITQSVLALSGYHLMAMTQEASASAFASGIQDLQRGDIAEGLKKVGLGAIVKIGKSSKDVFDTGRKLERQYRGIEDYGPEWEKVADLYAGAGGRVVGRGAEYRSSEASNYFTAFRRGAQKLEWQTGLNKVTEGNPLFAPARAAGFLGRELGRINETITAPLFDKAIPRLKGAAFYDEMSGWLKANPLADTEAQLAQARRIADTIDDRFGEMVMDNIFWGQATKQTLQIAATSLGWELGSLRSLGGSAFDAFRGEFSPRVRYVIGLGSAIMLENAIYQYLSTRKTPGQDIGGVLSPGGAVDLTVPRTGGKTPEGNYERALLPGFEKDILGYFHDPLGELAGKLSPFGRLATEIGLTGRDYFGNVIAPFPKYTPDWFRAYAKHVFGAMKPIPFQQESYKGSNIGFGQRFMGVRPAPERWQNPQRASDMEIRRDIGALRSKMRGLYGHGNRTQKETAELNKEAREIGEQIAKLQRQLGKPGQSRIYRPGAP